MNRNVSFIKSLIRKMSIEEKIGQMAQFQWRKNKDETVKAIINSKAGSVLNVTTAEEVNELQRLYLSNNNKVSIPLIIGRDVIHGFRTIFPIPLGQAAAWDPELVQKAAEAAADEAMGVGIRWTFAPMVDVTRDPRWGRVAEGGGEDPLVTSTMGSAMVRGFQSKKELGYFKLAACAKHFAGYGAAEGGRDYNTVIIPENVLREIYLPSFKSCVHNGVLTVMSAFNEINGIPCSGNRFLLTDILRKEWKFKGFVVSDWNAIVEMVIHGFAEDEYEAAKLAIQAGVDMEMVSTAYLNNLAKLIRRKDIPEYLIDKAVERILNVKYQLGLFENPFVDKKEYSSILSSKHLDIARELARKSFVLLKNRNRILPVEIKSIKSIALIGPLADDQESMLGCWSPDGKAKDVITVKMAMEEIARGNFILKYEPGIETARSQDGSRIEKAVKVASSADIIILCIGEDNRMSGEAHCRAFPVLPELQKLLVKELNATGKPVIGIIFAGRPLVLTEVIDDFTSLLYVWHPGTMAGPAIADILFGNFAPSGKLTISLPKAIGQIPVYYSHKNTGRPPPSDFDIPTGTPLDPSGFFSGYLDVTPSPLFPFGFGLSFVKFKYENLEIYPSKIKSGEDISVKVSVTNEGKMTADEVVQLYIRDIVARRTRPVKELKSFKRVTIPAGEKKTVEFCIPFQDLCYWNPEMEYTVEPGKFKIWVGSDSVSGLEGEFVLI